ncbi:MAG: G1 family glutamic endopeptidase [Acidimicrobiales bacterium]
MRFARRAHFSRSIELVVTIALVLAFSPTLPAGAATKEHGVPGEVRGVHAFLDESRATVRWKAPLSNGGSPIKHYRAVSHPSGFKCTTLKTTCSFAGLKIATKYSFTVFAANKYGNGPMSVPSNPITASSPGGTTGSPPPPPPPAPTPPPATPPPSGGGGGGGGAPPPTSYTVTFNANGGSGSMTSETSSTEVALTTNTFTYSGYTFDDWNTAANGLGTSYANEATYPFTASVTLYAQWTSAPSFTVTFDANGGSGTMASETSSSPEALSANTFTFAGYSFTSWNTMANGMGTAYGPGATYPFNASMTLYAQWTAIPGFTVTFNANGGSGSMAVETSSTAEALTTNSFTYSGYTFDDWNTDSDGLGTAYANDATYPFTSSVTLYAQWTAIPGFTVTFIANGGTGTMASETSSTAEALTANTFTYSGNTFDDWNTSANGLGTSYANDATYPFTSSVTLYAQWTAIPGFTVTFNANGGTGTMASETSTVAAPLTENTFTNGGDTFLDWNTKANGSGTMYLNGATYPFTSSVTLYAQWTTADAPTIVLDPTNQTVLVNGTGNFVAAAVGVPTPTVQWDVSTNGGSSWSPIAGATSTTYSLSTGSNNGWEFEAVFTNSHGNATTTSAEFVDLTLSGNWSGYYETNSDYTNVSGQWTVPTLTCNSSKDLQASEWVGIDGAIDNTVEQDGTETDCEGTTPVYGAWYEFFGDDSVNDGYEVPLSSSSYPVKPGDVVTGTVSFASGAWTFSLHDSTEGWTFSTSVANPSPPPSQDSAEWIVENPKECTTSCSIGQLADFGSVTFTNASATNDGTSDTILVASSDAVETLDNSNVVMMAPGVLSDDGTSFTVTWQSSS